jgi:putative ABC transport system substrate-binding protein
MRRRDFISFLGGAVAAWPIATRAQQSERMRRVGVLTGIGGADAETKVRISGFLQSLERLGWTEGRNLQVDIRGGAGSNAAVKKYAAELVTLRPDVILATGSVVVPALLEATHTIPIVFTIVIDPVGAGFVEDLSRPGGNATGYMMFEYSLSGKWVELLKEIAPGIKRVAVLRDPNTTSGIGQFAVIQTAAAPVGISVRAINVGDASEIERGVEASSRFEDVGLIVTASPQSVVHRKLIIALAARHKIPTVYIERLFVTEGGLISYGPNLAEQTRQAATYVDRILKGEKPADLPVQAPTKYELVLNLKTAKTLGLNVSPSLLARADEIIE